MRRIAGCLLVALAAFSIAAADNGSVELGLGTVDGRDTSGNGSSYAASWRQAIGDGRLGGRVHLERVNNVGDSGSADGFDAYNVDLDLLVNSDTYNRAQYYGGGGLGAVFVDAASISQTLDLSVGKYGGGFSTATAHAHSEQSQTAYLRWSAVAGLMILTNADRTMGVGFEVRYSGPLANIDVEDTLTGSAYVTFPVGAK